MEVSCFVVMVALCFNTHLDNCQHTISRRLRGSLSILTFHPFSVQIYSSQSSFHLRITILGDYKRHTIFIAIRRGGDFFS